MFSLEHESVGKLLFSDDGAFFGLKGKYIVIKKMQRWISEIKISKAIICSDSRSALVSLSEKKSELKQDIII